MFKKITFAFLLVMFLSQFGVSQRLRRMNPQVVVRLALRWKWRWTMTTITTVMLALMLTKMVMDTSA